MRVSLIVAVSENGVIGKDNDLIWNLPKDMKFFKETTQGKSCYNGKKKILNPFLISLDLFQEELILLLLVN